MRWQPIESAPRKTKIIVSDGVDFYAVGYLAISQWYLGEYPSKWRTRLGFEPRWWMPAGVACNPLKVAFPPTPPTA
jgi:hypothetical protein